MAYGYFSKAFTIYTHLKIFLLSTRWEVKEQSKAVCYGGMHCKPAVWHIPTHDSSFLMKRWETGLILSWENPRMQLIENTSMGWSWASEHTPADGRSGRQVGFLLSSALWGEVAHTGVAWCAPTKRSPTVRTSAITVHVSYMERRKHIVRHTVSASQFIIAIPNTQFRLVLTTGECETVCCPVLDVILLLPWAGIHFKSNWNPQTFLIIAAKLYHLFRT